MSNLVAATIAEGGICKCGHAAITHWKFPRRCDCCKCWRFRHSPEETARFLRETDPEYIRKKVERDFKEMMERVRKEYNLPTAGTEKESS